MDLNEFYSSDEVELFILHNEHFLPEPSAILANRSAEMASENEYAFKFDRLADYGDPATLHASMNRPHPKSDEAVLQDWAIYPERHPEPTVGDFCKARGVAIRTFHRIRQRNGVKNVKA